MSSIKLEKETSHAEEIEYNSPAFPGYSAQINYRFSTKSFISLEYASITSPKVRVDGDSANLQRMESGHCWYLGAVFDDWDNMCINHGGYSDATRSYAGSDGTNPQCADVHMEIGV